MPITEREGLHQEVFTLYGTISGLVSAASLISLTTKIFRIGLAPVLSQFVDVYRRVTHFCFDGLLFWMPLHFPGWYKDAFVISFALLALFIRSILPCPPLFPSWTDPGLRYDLPLRGLIFMLVFVGSLPLLGLLTLAYALYPVSPESVSEEHLTEVIASHRAFRISIIAMAVATIGFFALNSQL